MKNGNQQGWKECKLGELCSDIAYGYTESASLEPVGPKFLRITDIVPGRVSWATVPYCKISNENRERYKLQLGDIVIARTGATTGYTYTIKPVDLKHDAVFASYLIRYRIDREKAEPFYIGHLLTSRFWDGFVEGILGGSAQPGANAKQFADFEILLPPLPEQRAIAGVLSSLDDKIDLLHRQNKTLEGMAKALWRKMFVEEADPGWKKEKLGDLGQIVCGKTPSKKVAEYFGGHIPFIKIPDMHGNVFIFETEDSLTELGMKFQQNKTIPAKSICVSCIATVGLVCMNAIDSQTNQQINTIIPNKEFQRYFLFLLMRNMTDDLFARASGGTATDNLNTGDFSRIEIVMPSESNIQQFDGLVKNYFDKIYLNQIQICTLSSLRDTLLPKLMNGEVRVS